MCKACKLLIAVGLAAAFFPVKLEREYNGDLTYETLVFGYKAFTDPQGKYRTAFTVPSAALKSLVDEIVKENA